ncbi:MAG TPA: glycosyltransferase family 4 protein, partial [Acidimicrobiales bacterium]|nr:glycosyltransferase family 4 protein [Acidimicrobiales bacterium]
MIPTRRARGAQREARAIADRLDRPGERAHRVLSLFAGSDEVRADVAMELRGGRPPGTGFQPPAVRALRRRLRALDPALVVAHGSEPLKYLVPALAGSARPLAYYAIGTYSGPRRAVRQALWRALLARPDLVLAEGDEVAEECRASFGLDPSRVVMAPNGRDPEVFCPPPPGSSAEGPPTVAFVGALTPGKRPDRFVYLVGDLRRDGVDLRAVAVGDGPLRDQLRPAAERAGVELLGHRADVADLLRAADVLVFPSDPEGEGMPGVLIEAGLTGIPVVATDVPGVRSVLVDGRTGFVVGVGDREGMAAAVRRLLEHPELRAGMGEAGRARCL